jgi:hypothetical protein
MSLEAAIQANTTAINNLLAAITSMGGIGRAIPDAPAGMVGRPAGPSKEEAAAKSEATTITPAVQAELDRVKAANAAKTEAAPTAVALDYEKDVKPLALQLAKAKGRDALIKVLGEFGLAQANQAKPEQFAAIVAKINEALTAGE